MTSMKPQTTKRQPNTEQIIAEQKRIAERDTAARKAAVAKSTAENSAVEKRIGDAGATVPATVAPNTAVAIRDTRTPIDQYLDLVAPASIVGRLLRFDGKGGRFITPDNDEEVDSSIDFIALCDQTLIGWIKFNGEGNPPDKKMGLLYDHPLSSCRHATAWVMTIRQSGSLALTESLPILGNTSST
jgi:hypothetical protein